MKKQFKLTKAGINELQTEVDGLIAQRGDIAERIKIARDFGDLAENGEYQAARADQDRVEGRISEIEYILKNAEVIKAPKIGGKVQLGSKVTLKNNGGTKNFQVVGTVEADPLEGKISDESPIGKALLGKKVGDAVEIVTPADTITFKVAEIA